MSTFKAFETQCGQVQDVFGPLVNKKIWYDKLKDIYVIFEQYVERDKQFCYWYNGEVATIIMDDHIIKLNAVGDVKATYDNHGHSFVLVNDSKDQGKFCKVFSEIFDRDYNLQVEMITKKLKIGTPNWQIDVWKMRPCSDINQKLQQHLFPIEVYLDSLKGSYYLNGYYLSDVLNEIIDNKNSYLEIYS